MPWTRTSNGCDTKTGHGTGIGTVIRLGIFKRRFNNQNRNMTKLGIETGISSANSYDKCISYHIINILANNLDNEYD